MRNHRAVKEAIEVLKKTDSFEKLIELIDNRNDDIKAEAFLRQYDSATIDKIVEKLFH